MYHSEGCGFKRFSIGYGQNSGRFGLELGIIFQETEQMVDDFSLDLGNCKLTPKT